MKIQNISDSARNKLVEMILCDPDCIHILWNCRDNSVLPLNGDLFPAGCYDPLEFIYSHAMISGEHVRIFEAFCDEQRSAVAFGSDKCRGELVVSIDTGGGFALHRVTAIYLRDQDDRVTDMHIMLRRFSEKEKSERLILDVFTSDKAPQIFGRRIREMMNRFSDSNIAFIQFDIERFKLINDNYGVETGDAMLKFMGDTLASFCSDDQPFARLTADVFMVVTRFDSEDELVPFIRRLEDRLLGFRGIDYHLNFGVAIAEDKSLHTRTHGDNATVARQSIKGNALNNIGFYNGSLKTKLYKQHSIEKEMDKALKNNEFVMYLQPKFSISTGKIIGAEALTRWIHPEKGMIPPNDFIPVFEQNGFILKLDMYIWECACKKLREWLDRGIQPVPISVNISREYLKNFDVVSKFKELVAKYDIPVGLLEAEITESADSAETANIVRKMKAEGFTMLMDDFGSGYSSLTSLKAAPFDVLKIDRSFLTEFLETDRGKKIIEHTISMSGDIGLDIIAEGVETHEQAEFLSSCGCDAVQGFLYSKPVPTAEFDIKLSENSGKEK